MTLPSAAPYVHLNAATLLTLPLARLRSCAVQRAESRVVAPLLNLATAHIRVYFTLDFVHKLAIPNQLSLGRYLV